MNKATFTGEIHTEDFVHRTVSFDPPSPVLGADDEIQLRVTRTRTSNGFASICLQFGKERIELNSDLTPGYEQVALMIAELLTKAAEHGCTLPPLTPKETT